MSSAFSGDSSRLEFPQLLEKPTRSINMVQLGDALTRLTPPVKALFVYSSNPLSVAPDASQVRKGLAREDLFTVVHEQFLTPTARYADLLLPATTSFENCDVYTGYGHFQMGRVEPVIPRPRRSPEQLRLVPAPCRKDGLRRRAVPPDDRRTPR